MSATYTNMKQVLPTQENLNELLEKLLAIFGVESILKRRELPLHPVQREHNGSPDIRHIIRPISGNDFHIQMSATLSPSWEAVLRLEQAGGSDICVPLCHIDQHLPFDGRMTTVQSVATLLRAAWPDASIGPSRRTQLGPDFDDTASSYQIFRWLASKQLNPVSEGIFLSNFVVSEGRRFEQLRQKNRGLVLRSSAEADWKQLSVASHPAETNGRYHHDPDTELWSFTGGPQNWVISLPVICTILLLMTNPTKEVNSNLDCPDRELSWCLDSLHGFCRRRGPNEGSRDLSWSQGTFPDYWMYLHFVFYYVGPDDEQYDEAERWRGTGIPCERRNFELPIGWDGSIERFEEKRFWFGMRTSTTYGDVKEHQATVAFIARDSYHFPYDVKHKTWLKRGLESPDGASGVALFHMLLWSGMDEWSRGWNGCLEYIDRLHELKIEDLDSPNPKLSAFMSNETLANAYFVTIQLLKTFCGHIDVLPRSLYNMRREWERTYPALDADLLERFNEETQETLLKNWDRLMEHVQELHSSLMKRIEKKINDLASRRDSIFLTRALKN